jgi:hypothetical protein
VENTFALTNSVTPADPAITAKLIAFPFVIGEDVAHWVVDAAYVCQNAISPSWCSTMPPSASEFPCCVASG